MNITNKTNEKKRNRNQILLILILFVILINSGLIIAPDTTTATFAGGYNPVSFSAGAYRTYGSSTNPQFSNPSFFNGQNIIPPETYWPKFNKEDCLARQDMILQIAPGGCSPSIVTSDLLEEQNVPVFCKVMAVQINPLIDVSRIRSIHFATNNLPKGVSSVSYYPAQAAIKSQISLTSSPVKDNLGYLVIVLAKPTSGAEKDIPNSVQGNVTATIDYDVQGAFGIGRTNFYVSELSDEEWNRDYNQYGFWNGKGYVRAEVVEPDRATIAIYRDFNTRQAEINLMKGETSKDIYLSGFYCAAGMNIRLESVDAPVDSALLQIDNQQIWVSKGETLLDGKCTVTDLQTYAGGGKVSINCMVSNGKFDLTITPGKAGLNVNGIDGQYYIGQKISSGVVRSGSYAQATSNPENFVYRIYDSATKNYIFYRYYAGVWMALISNSKNANWKDVSKYIAFGLIFSAGATPQDGLKTLRDKYSSMDYINKQSGNIETGAGDASSDVFLGYVGKDYKGNDFVVLVSDSTSSNENEFADKGVYEAVDKIVKATNKEITDKDFQKKINDSVVNAYKIKLKTQNLDKTLMGKDFVRILLTGQNYGGIVLKESYVAKDRDWSNEKDSSKLLAKSYHDQSIKTYQDLVDLYPSEKNEANEIYASQGLLEAAQLAKKFNMNKQSEEMYTKLINQYLDSGSANQAKIEKDLLTRFDSYQARAVVNINGEKYFFNLLNFKKPVKGDLNVVLLINGKEQSLGVDEMYEVKKDNKNGTIQIKEIKDDYVNVRYFKTGTNLLGSGSQDAKLTLKTQTGQQTLFENFITVKLINISSRKEAKLTIIPKAFGPRMEANFSFGIGIEKRAIQLSPQRTKELIASLDDTIKQWSDANQKLGQVIKVMKGVCFATAATLTIKNLLTGFSGESMARSALMTKQGGWNDFCRKAVEDKTAGKNGQPYSTIQSCLLDYNNEIEKDIQTYTSAIDNTNRKLKEIQNNLKPTSTDPLDMQGQVQPDKVRQAYYEQVFAGFYEQNKNKVITLSNGQSATLADIAGGHPEKMSLEDMKNLVTFSQVSGSGESRLSSVFSNQLGKDLLYTYQLNEQTRQNDALVGAFQNRYGGQYPVFSSDKGTKLQTMYAIRDSDSQLRNDLGFSDRMFIDTISSSSAITESIRGKRVAVGLVNNGGVYKIQKAITEERRDVTQDIQNYYSNTQKIDSFKLADPKAYQNRIVSIENLRVKYFEQAPYKGMPAEVPFDVDNGWYAEMEYVLSGFGKPYDESGRVINFYICNVGANGRIDFKQSGDDICRYYNGDVNSLDFPGMTTSESRSLISKAQQAITEAAKQYSTSSRGVQIGSRVFKSATSLAGNAGRCSDFMSPMDCNIMFNVCDPVICPSSRCNFGGNYQVDNVIQTGIIGGLLLCLPNIKEGIYVPICLSGINAGIDGWVDTLNKTRRCLNESLATGRNVGICDAVKSIYLCKLFWEQATPLLNVAIPRFIQSLYSQGVRGGGEYLTVQSAWDNTQKAVDYFKNDYAVNSMKAFTSRSTAEVGSEVCKSFTSVAYPGSADFFDRLLEPDSPVQYTAWFSEDILTTATIPSTSHYKVYYHIYAGKDQDTYYTVYLKDLSPASSSVPLATQYMVDSGSIPRGNSIDISKDFTAVSGYKQLCLNINGQDKCGFKSVSSSFALNEISNVYAADQITTDIKTQSACVAGTPSALSLANINIQAGIREMINPELYKRGIIQVCSTENPGKRVDANGQYDQTNSTSDRWKQVGYCDDPTIKCWLDTVSVKNVITDLGLRNEVLGNVDKSIFSQGLLTDEQGKTIANDAQNRITAITTGTLKIDRTDNQKSIDSKVADIIGNLKNLTNIGLNNAHRARGTYLLAKLYKIIAEQIYGDGGTNTGGLLARAQNNPGSFVYRIYVQGNPKYTFLIYQDGVWKYLTSTDPNYNWKYYADKFQAYSLLSGHDASRGFNYLLGSYNDPPSRTFRIIDIASGETLDMTTSGGGTTSIGGETSAAGTTATGTTAISMLEKAKQNPENFIYRTYVASGTYTFVVYDSDIGWKYATSLDVNYDWQSNLNQFRAYSLMSEVSINNGLDYLINNYNTPPYRTLTIINMKTGEKQTLITGEAGTETSLEEKATQNPEAFVYKIYDKNKDSFIFYFYDSSNKVWMMTYAKETSFDWKTNINNFVETRVITSFQALLETYPSSDYVFYYIDRVTGETKTSETAQTQAAGTTSTTGTINENFPSEDQLHLEELMLEFKGASGKIYYRYIPSYVSSSNPGWQFSLDIESANWVLCSNTNTIDTYYSSKLSESQKSFIKTLSTSSFKSGVTGLLQRVGYGSEVGGIFTLYAKPYLKVYSSQSGTRLEMLTLTQGDSNLNNLDNAYNLVTSYASIRRDTSPTPTVPAPSIPPYTPPTTTSAPGKTSNLVFELQDGTNWANVYYRYSSRSDGTTEWYSSGNAGWYFSITPENIDSWVICSDSSSVESNTGLNSDSKFFINSMSKKDFDSGIKALLEKTKISPGGFVANPALVVYMTQLSKLEKKTTYNKDSVEIQNEANYDAIVKFIKGYLE